MFINRDVGVELNVDDGLVFSGSCIRAISLVIVLDFQFRSVIPLAMLLLLG